MKSRSGSLVGKSLGAVLSAMEIYNKPDFHYREESFSILMVNPFAKQLKKQVTIRMGVDIIEYFKNMSVETGIPYQNLINLYLRECVTSQRKLTFQ